MIKYIFLFLSVIIIITVTIQVSYVYRKNAYKPRLVVVEEDLLKVNEKSWKKIWIALSINKSDL